MTSLLQVPVNIRRFDLTDSPSTESVTLQFDPNLSFLDLKKEIFAYFEISDEESKVIKLRNNEYVLVPIMNLLTDLQCEHTIDISRTIVTHPSEANQLHDAYLDAVKQKLRTMESRMTNVEVLVPELQWRQQTHLDCVVNNLSSKVCFLNRRIDELMPAEWKDTAKAVQT